MKIMKFILSFIWFSQMALRLVSDQNKVGGIFSLLNKTATCQKCLCALKAHTETLAMECRLSDEVIYTTLHSLVLTTALRVPLYLFIVFPCIMILPDSLIFAVYLSLTLVVR